MIPKILGILHLTPKVLYTFLKDIPTNCGSLSGKCKAGNEGCQILNTFFIFIFDCYEFGR